ncbi:MAG: hypothetical protein LBD16_05670 [Oscillospiraceae bacterium]|nr:hypothetical protein [Oscillospiraceae bacterium]
MTSMARRIVSILLSLTLLLGGTFAFAEEIAVDPIDPELFVGQQASLALSNALLEGKKLVTSGTVSIDGLEAFGEEAGLVSLLIGSMLATDSIQIGENEVEISLKAGTKDGSADVFSGNVIINEEGLYIKSDLLGDVAYSLNFNELSEVVTAAMNEMMPVQEISPELLEAILALSDANLYLPLLTSIVNWVGENVVVVTAEEFAKPANHPEAVTLSSLTVTPEQIQALVSGVMDTLATDDALITAILTLVAATGEADAEEIPTVEEVKALIAELKPQIEIFVPMLIKTIQLDSYADASGKTVSEAFTFGFLTTEGESCDFTYVYDFKREGGIADESIALSVSFPGGIVVLTAATELQPIYYDEAQETYTRVQSFNFGLELRDTEVNETILLQAAVDTRDINTPTTETTTTKLNYIVSGIEVFDESMPLSFEITERAETTFGENGFFSTKTTVDVDYGAILGLPSVHAETEMHPEEAAPVVVPSTSINLLTLTEEDISSIAFVVQQNLMTNVLNFLSAIGIDMNDTTTIVEQVDPPTELPAVETVPNG